MEEDPVEEEGDEVEEEVEEEDSVEEEDPVEEEGEEGEEVEEEGDEEEESLGPVFLLISSICFLAESIWLFNSLIFFISSSDNLFSIPSKPLVAFTHNE